MAKPKLTEEQVIEELAGWAAKKRKIEDFERLKQMASKEGGALEALVSTCYSEANEILAKLKSLGHKSPFEVRATERAAMERVFDRIERENIILIKPKGYLASEEIPPFAPEVTGWNIVDPIALKSSLLEGQEKG